MSGSGNPWDDFKPGTIGAASPAQNDGPWNDFKSAKAAAPPTAAAPSPGFGDTAIDMMRSVPGGLLQGVTSIEGMTGNSIRAGAHLIGAGANLVHPGAGYAVNSAYDTVAPYLNAVAPTSDKLNADLTSPIGGFYDPKTALGHFSETAASFVPAVFGGEAATIPQLVGRVASRVLLPAATGEIARQAASGTPYQDTAAALGTLAGGLPSLARAGVRAVAPLVARRAASAAEPLDPVAASLVQKYEGMGGNLRPGQYSPANIIRQGDSVVSDTPFPRLAGFSPNSQTRISPAAQTDQFNTLLSNTFGENSPRLTGDVLANARTRIGNVYNTVLPRNSIVADQPLNTALDSVENRVSEAAPAMDARDVTKITGVLNKLRGQMSADGGFTGRQYQIYRGRDGVLDELASSGAPTISRAATDIRGALDEAFARQAQGEDASLLQKANQQYRALSTIQPVAAKAANGNVSPKLLLGAVNGEYGHPDNAGDLGILARVGKAFISEPANSGTSERTLWRTLQHSPVKAARMSVDNLLAAPYSALVTRGINSTINSPAMRDQLLSNAPLADVSATPLGAALQYVRAAAPARRAKP